LLKEARTLTIRSFMPSQENPPEMFERLLQKRNDLLSRQYETNILQIFNDLRAAIAELPAEDTLVIETSSGINDSVAAVRATVMELFEQRTKARLQELYLESVEYLDRLQSLVPPSGIPREQLHNLLYQAYDALALNGSEYIRVRSIFEPEIMQAEVLGLIVRRRKELEQRRADLV